MQLKYGLKKEWMEYFGTKRWLAFLLPMLFFIFVDPLMAVFMPMLAEMLPGMESLAAMYPNTQEFGLTLFCADAMQMGVLVLLLSMMRTAGGDQKNKSCVIPICNGMKRETYILSKFLLYPAIAFGVSVMSYLVAYAYTWFLFEEKLLFTKLLLPMLAFGLFLAFLAALMLSVGCMTGKAGISAAVIFLAITFLNMILSPLKLNHYHPLALMTHATAFDKVDYLEYWSTVGIVLLVGVLLYFVTAAVFRRKRLV